MLFLKSNMKKEKVRKSENNLPKRGKRRGHLWQILLPYVPVNGRPVCKVCWRRFSSLSMMQDGQEEKKTKSGRWWGTGRLQRRMKSPGQVECGDIVMHHT